MALIYQIKNTNGDTTITVVPAGINGSIKNNADSDVNLIGQGATIWGESLNESFYRLAENFACQQKVLGDFLPGTDTAGDFPPGSWAGNGSYNPVVDPVMPKDELDLGTGLGINNPIPGQLWFNTDTNKASVYSGTSSTFQSVNSVTVDVSEPLSPQNGDLWYDTAISQLKIFNGVAFASVAERYLLLDGTDTMAGDLNIGGNIVTNIADLTGGSAGTDGANKNYVDQEITTLTGSLTGGLLDPQYVNVTSDTMSGTLAFGTAMTLNVGGGSSLAGPDIEFSFDGLLSVTDTIHLHIDSDNNNSGEFRVSKGANNTSGSQVRLFTVENNGTLTVQTTNYENLVTSNNDIPNKKYVDDVAAATGVTGGVQMFAGTVAPLGFLMCDGSAVNRITYATLFTLIGTTFGSGDGSTTFNIPDFRGRVPGGVGIASPSPSYGNITISLAQKLGNWYSRLTSVNQMPSHNHNGGNHTHWMYRNETTWGRQIASYPNNAPAYAGSGGGGGSDTYNIGASNYSNNSANTGKTNSVSNISAQGSSSNISTYQPMLGINFIIKT